MNRDLLEGEEIYLVVKSLDQVERRQQLILDKEKGRLGRMAPRQTARGCLARVKLDGRFLNAQNSEWTQTFREPRGLCVIGNGNLFLTEIDRVLEITPAGDKVREFYHDYFAFLHTVVFDESRSCFLVVSAGYDAVFEVSYPDGKVVWEWFGWEHGFNPNRDGEFLTRRPFEFQEFKTSNLKCRFVNPQEYGETGLLTGGRTTHPSAACYDPDRSGRIFLVAGMENNVLSIDRETGCHQVVLPGLAPMPHALMPYDGGWIVTDTMKGAFRVLDAAFETRKIIDFSTLPGKACGLERHEWLQGVFPLKEEGRFAAVDSNRGLFVVDLKKLAYFCIEVDESWCVQQILESL